MVGRPPAAASAPRSGSGVTSDDWTRARDRTGRAAVSAPRRRRVLWSLLPSREPAPGASTQQDRALLPQHIAALGDTGSKRALPHTATGICARFVSPKFDLCRNLAYADLLWEKNSVRSLKSMVTVEVVLQTRAAKFALHS